MTTPIIIAGSRNYHDRDIVFHHADLIMQKWKLTDVTVLSGSCRGVDLCGEAWAVLHGHSILRFPANWNLHGKAAGPVRNKEMAENALRIAKEYRTVPLLLAFPKGESWGTRSMIRIAELNELTVTVVEVQDSKEDTNR